MAQEIVGSRMRDFSIPEPADNTKTGYGQNGYEGASSDTDLKNPTRSAMSVKLFPNPKVVFVDQTRDVGKSNVQPSFGMTQRSPRNR